VVELVDLAHGVVEDGGDDAAVAVAWGSGVALAQAKAADESLAGFVKGKFEVHAIGVVEAAAETVVLLQLGVPRVVSVDLRLAGHWEILSWVASSVRFPVYIIGFPSRGLHRSFVGHRTPSSG
jgi:hypothetical protein